MRSGTVGAATTLVTMVALAGCGSGSGGGSGSGASSATKAQFLARANAVCGATAKKLEALTAPSLTEAKLEKAIREGVRLEEQANAELQKIPRPAADAAPAEWLHWRMIGTADGRKLIEAKPSTLAPSTAGGAEREAFAKARSIAAAYGLTTCAAR